VDTATQALTAQIPGTTGQALAVNPQSSEVYVAAGSIIDVVDPGTNTVTGTIPLAAAGIAFSPDGSEAYVAGQQKSVQGVAVIDTATLEVTSFVTGITLLRSCHAGCGQSIVVTTDGQYIYAAGSPGAIINTQTLAIIASFNSNGQLVAY
jgi:DNA-binding beta-propeller fold protein YncE